MTLLALDFGERRIGVAGADPLGLTARPLAVIERTSLAEDMARIGEIARRRGAKRIVLGLPLNMDGTEGPQAKRVKRFAGRLTRELGLEVELWDERLTTVEAEHVLLAADKSRADRRRRDDVAAAVILEDYLAAKRRSADR
jgi:putative Holliday junction resolvase